MPSSRTTAQPEQVHLHIKKTATASNATPRARCRNCTANGKLGVDSRWICDTCPKQPGLCSKECFRQWHNGFEILLATRPLRPESAPEQPQEPEEEALEPQEGVEVIKQLASELLSAADWARRQERLHTLTIKPPTQKKQDPKLACIECRFHGRKRRDRRTICKVCTPQRGFCSIECLQEHHKREGIFQSSSQDNQRES